MKQVLIKMPRQTAERLLKSLWAMTNITTMDNDNLLVVSGAIEDALVHRTVLELEAPKSTGIARIDAEATE